MKKMIISVHVPKAAGTSFRRAIGDYFGDRLMLKYGERPFNLTVFERNRKALVAAVDNCDASFEKVHCIHGHFLPAQFILLKEVRPLTFITWMRDPVERIVSDYFHTLRNYNDRSPPLQKRIIQEKWSLEKYCLNEIFRDVYSQFFWSFPLENFDFIGITEHYASDLLYFGRKFLNAELCLYHENINTASGGKYTLDKTLRGQIESFHARDMVLYQRALQVRNERMKQQEI